MTNNVCPKCGMGQVYGYSVINSNVWYYICERCSYKVEDRTEEKEDEQYESILPTYLPEVLIETKNIKL